MKDNIKMLIKENNKNIIKLLEDTNRKHQETIKVCNVTVYVLKKIIEEIKKIDNDELTNKCIEYFKKIDNVIESLKKETNEK